ncbi:unnamed protein product, partial [Mesorhabditis spiculigera]
MIRGSKVGFPRTNAVTPETMGGADRKGSNASRITVISVPAEGQSGVKYTKKELKEYRQIFAMFDTDGSGAIGNEELKQAMISIGISVDADGNGEIDFNEFCACMKKSQTIAKSTNEELIKECFSIFDLDQNGVISEDEFKYIAKEVGNFDDELAEKVFRELDISSAGQLTGDQFANIVEDYLLNDNARYPDD